MNKPDAPSVHRNREPILEVLREYFADRHQVLEIGSGTGQHAVHFAAALPHLHWQPTERASELDGVRAWRNESGLANLREPLELDVLAAWPAMPRHDAVFTSNTLHIMGWAGVQALFAALPGVTTDDARLVVYGAFNYHGGYTSPSNADFDAWLKRRDPASGLRDFEAVDALAREAGFVLQEDRAMPANNRCLIWQRG